MRGAGPEERQVAARPERVVVAPARDAAAFVVGETVGSSADTVGWWYGPLDGEAARMGQTVPDTNLVFSPDGSAIAMALQGGEQGSRLVIHPLASDAVPAEYALAGFVERLVWTEDGLVALSADPGADAASLTSGKPLPAEAEDPLVRRAPAGWRRLWMIDPATGASYPFSRDGLSVWELAPVPGGGAVVVASEDPSEAGWYHSSLVRLGPEPGAARVLHRSDWQLQSPTISPDGRSVAFIEGWSSDRGLVAGEARVIELATGSPSAGLAPGGAASPDLASSAVRTVAVGADVTSLSWAGDGRLWFAGWHHLGTAWGWIDTAQADAVTLIEEAAACLNSRWHPEVVPLDATSALTVRSTPAQPPEVVRLAPAGDARAWTSLNVGLGKSRHLTVRELRWPAADGLEIEALLVEPVGDVAQPWPLVVDIHGGPSLAYHHDWDLTWGARLAEAGYAVVMANPRGSAGRGQAFARANLGDPAGAEFDDLLAGIAHCVESGLVDPGRVASMGASYGGYLTAWAVATGGPFACGVVIAGISDLVSCWGTANNSPFYDYLLAAPPAAAPARYLERSPVTRIDARSRPALILHGAIDQCVPVGQAEELYHGLREVGVEAELVVYPREGHQVAEADHVADQHHRVLEWLAAHPSPIAAGAEEAR
jgi:dipeptidyl aminopeptidase/acylaminoacyl peptidase